MPTQVNNQRIAKNTLLLYGRMLLIMAVSLYTSRVVLNTMSGGLRHLQCRGRYCDDVRIPQWGDGDA